MTTYRLFTAIDISDQARAAVARICAGIPGVRWVDQSQLHLTLRFIGDAEVSLFERIRNGLAGIDAVPFELSLLGVGRFPPKRDPRVLWVGVAPNEALTRLQRLVEQALVRCGVEPEGREFSPHITLARLKDVPFSRVASFLEANRDFSTPLFPVTEFHLYSSSLTPHGAIHKREAIYHLKG